MQHQTGPVNLVFVFAVAAVATPNRTSQSVFKANQHTVNVFVDIGPPITDQCHCTLLSSLFWADRDFFWAEICLKLVKMETNLKLTGPAEKLFFDVLRLF